MRTDTDRQTDRQTGRQTDRPQPRGGCVSGNGGEQVLLAQIFVDADTGVSNQGRRMRTCSAHPAPLYCALFYVGPDVGLPTVL